MEDRARQEERRREAHLLVGRDRGRGPLGRALGLTQEQAARRVRDAQVRGLREKAENKR